MCIFGKGKTIYDAEQVAEKACAAVSGPVYHRRDIGTKQLIDKKMARMEEIMA